MAGGDDAAHRSADVGQDVAGRHSENAKAECSERPVTRGVSRWLVAACLMLAIDFDAQACGQAGEIETVVAEWMLTPELEPARTSPQRAPEQYFGQVPAAALAARQRSSGGGGVEHPSTTRLRRAVPLPVPGRYLLTFRHIRNTPKRGACSTGALRQAVSARPSTSRVWAGSITPSSHSRAVA